MVNVKDVQLGTTTRKSFAKINEVMKMPNLIEVQKSSYRWFLEEGLKEVFKDIGEISDYTGNLVLDFVDFSIDDEPKYSIAQCKDPRAQEMERADSWETGTFREPEGNGYRGDGRRDY